MASRKEEKDQLRQERLEREAAESEKKAKQKKARVAAIIGGGVLVVVAVSVALFAMSGGDDDKNTTDADAAGFVSGPAPTAAIAIKESSPSALAAAAKKAQCELNENENEGAVHKEPSEDFAYEANPPTSGDHTPTWAEDGAYPEAAYTTPFYVHALEHGRIEYQWDPAKVTPQQIGTIKKLYDADTYHRIIFPNTTEMPYAVAATAWDNSLTCEKFNEDVPAALQLFALEHIDQGPEQVP